MSQPQWQFVANLGDGNPLTYDGYFVYRDATGVYPPEAEVIEGPYDLQYREVEPTDPCARWIVRRFVLEPCTFADGVLSDNPFHKDKPAWFADRLADVAASSGHQSADELRADLCSDDPLRRAGAYEDLGRYFGFHEFGADELHLSREEMAERYPQFADELGLRDWQIGGKVEHDERGLPVYQIKECGHCGFRWNDAVITSRTPVPAGRCPVEPEHEADDE